MDSQPSTSSTSRPPRVSWLLCTHRDDDLLYRAIQSCLTQTLTDFELLIVVNGTDAANIASALRLCYADDARVRVEETPVHMLNFSLSFGLHMARAPLVARMDADDVAPPERLERQVAYMERDPSLVVLGSSYQLIDATGKLHGRVDLPEQDAEIRRKLPFCNPICHPSVMLRRDAVLSVGAYLGGQNAEDYDLWLRLALNPDWRFANMPDLLLCYNVEPSGTARASRKAYANVAAAQLRNFLVTGSLRWLAGAFLTCAKTILRATKA